RQRRRGGSSTTRRNRRHCCTSVPYARLRCNGLSQRAHTLREMVCGKKGVWEGPKHHTKECGHLTPPVPTCGEHEKGGLCRYPLRPTDWSRHYGFGRVQTAPVEPLGGHGASCHVACRRKTSQWQARGSARARPLRRSCARLVMQGGSRPGMKLHDVAFDSWSTLEANPLVNWSRSCAAYITASSRLRMAFTLSLTSCLQS